MAFTVHIVHSGGVWSQSMTDSSRPEMDRLAADFRAGQGLDDVVHVVDSSGQFPQLGLRWCDVRDVRIEAAS